VQPGAGSAPKQPAPLPIVEPERAELEPAPTHAATSAAIESILRVIGHHVHSGAIAHILAGTRAPVVEEFVARNDLLSFYGACAPMAPDDLKQQIEELRDTQRQSQDADSRLLWVTTASAAPAATQHRSADEASDQRHGTSDANAHVPDSDAMLHKRIGELVDMILNATGGDLTSGIMAGIFAGSRRPVVEALVAHYHLEAAFGTLAPLEPAAIKPHIVHARRTKPRPEAIPGMDLPHAEAMHTPDPAIVAPMVVEIEQAIGYRLWGVMLAHILRGSAGPKVTALVTQHNVPYYGALREFGFSTVKATINAARAPQHDAHG
jgi:hypothetical protein